MIPLKRETETASPKTDGAAALREDKGQEESADVTMNMAELKARRVGKRLCGEESTAETCG